MANPSIPLEQFNQTRSNILESQQTTFGSTEKNMELHVGVVDDAAASKIYKVNKIAALSMMDIALLTANSNQLRFLCTYNTTSPTYYASLCLVIASLILQLCVGIGFIFKRQMKNSGRDNYLGKTNNILTAGIFLITVINVFIASFTVTDT